MDTASVILSRIVRVGPGPGNAAAGAGAQEQHAAAAGVGAQEQQNAAAAEAEAQEQQHAAAAGAGAQEQHAAAVGAPYYTLEIVQAPAVTVLTAGRGAHPNPEEPDASPYIIGAGYQCLLAHFSMAPFSGMLFAVPIDSHLIAVRDFHIVEGRVSATVDYVPNRTGYIPILWNIGNVALATNYNCEYMIAELQVDRGTDRAAIIYLRSKDHTGWAVKRVAYPLAAHNRDWNPSGAVYANGALWWFDLSWGIISYDYDASLLPVLRRDSNVDLVFHPLPDARVLAAATIYDTTVDISTKRCVTASRNKLRYVEIITEGEAARVCMWSRGRNPHGWQWYVRYAVSFEDIWDDDSYRRTGLPRNVPVLVVVCSSDPDLVYFSLEQDIFGVNVPEHRVVSQELNALVHMPLQPSPISGRFAVAWDLPPDIAQVLV